MFNLIPDNNSNTKRKRAAVTGQRTQSLINQWRGLLREKLNEACANKSYFKATRWREAGEAFGVRRPAAPFPPLHFANDPLKSSDPFSDSKAGKAAPGRRAPKASPIPSG